MMHAEKKRVFVGNLPPDTTQTDIAKRFSKFGNVLSVEIKQRPDSSTFAFLDFMTDENKLNSCFATLSTKKWNGKRIKLELAKESFLSRLEKERQENNKSKPHCSLDNPCMINTGIKSKKRSVEELGFAQNKQKTEKTISVVNDCSFDEEAVRSSDNSSDSEILYSGKLKMFGGTRTALCDSENNRSHSEIEPGSKISQSASAATDLLQRLEIFSDVWRDPPMNYDPTKHGKTITKIHNFKEQSPMDKAKSLLAEEKRKKSVDEKRKSFQKQKETIKLALNSVDSGFRNNKIVFDSEDYENKTEDTVKQTVSNNISSSSDAELLGKSDKKTILFEDSSDGEEEGNFKVKSQFEGIKGQKLLELQSQFASDNRFALDERFYESDEEVSAEASDSVQIVEDERRRQFEILQDVLGHQIPITNDKKDKSKRVSMLRFDPTKPDHAKFEKKTESKIKRKVPDISPDKKPKAVYDTKEDKVENVAVSKEKFYKVAESLKETLQERDEKNEFSLRKLFGASDGVSDDEEKGATYSATTLNKHKQKEWTKNPFKYDSSDSEEETENVTRNKTDNSQQNVNENMAYSGESFFFKLNDARLQEGLEFFSRSQIKDELCDFAKRRRELKQIVRCKVKNNLRNHRPWKKKLGGQKAKKFKEKQ